MPHLCLDCFEVYDDEIMLNTKYALDTEMFCPKKSCQGNVVEIDELLLLPIKILNKKGYITKYCCSGHVYDQIPNTYILFEDDIELPNLPKGFIKEEKSNCIRVTYDRWSNETKRQNEIFKTIVNLLDWANKLETNEY